MKKWFQLDKQKPLIFVLKIFVVWQILIVIFAGLGQLIPMQYTNSIYAEREDIVNPPIFWTRANFDGIHYLDIAKNGYGIYQQVFFPLYPGFIKFLTPYFGGRALTAGLMISWFSFLGALFFFYKLIKLDFDEKIVKRTLVYFLIFPTSFFFSVVYTESLFLFLVLSSFYFARKRNWWLAGILGALASATRLVGIFLLPALLWEWWEQQKVKSPKLKVQSLLSLIPIFLVAMGLLFYMRFLAINYNDSLMFAHLQSVDKIIPLYQVFWRYLKMLLTTKLDPIYFMIWLEFLTTVGFLVLLVFAYLRKIHFPYLVFALLAFIFPTTSGTLLSMPRFVLVLFPCFIVLALIEAKKIRWLLLALSFLLFAISTILFTRGYWVG